MKSVSKPTVNQSTQFAMPERTTPERAAQGVELDVIDGVQRVRSGPASLRSSSRIDDAELLATERWYKNYALAVHGARDSNSSGSGGGQEGLSLAILQAVEAHRAASEAVGRDGDAILRAFVADGRSLRAMAAGNSGPAREKAARAVVATIKQLAEHYHQRDNARQKDRIPRITA